MALTCSDVVLQPLQQTGGQPIKSKQPPPCFLHHFEAEASAVRPVVWFLTEEFMACFPGIVIVRVW